MAYNDFILSRDYHLPVMPRMSVRDEFDPNDTCELVDTHYLRYLRPSDMEDIRRVAESCWDEAMATTLVHQAQEMFSRKDVAIFVIQKGSKDVIGFTGIRHSWVMPHTAEMIGVTVMPEHQGKGFGGILTRARLELAKELGMEYVMVSTIVPGFFKEFGFEEIDIHGEWVLMRKVLK